MYLGFYRPYGNYYVFRLGFGPLLLASLFLFCASAPSYAEWQKMDVGFAFGEQGCLAIGDGRNGGVVRVYSGDGSGAGCGGNIYEFSFSGSQWGKVRFGEIETQYGTDNLCQVTGLDIRPGRDDGVNRVYGAGYGVAEFSSRSGSWSGTDIGGDLQWTNDVVVGPGRNDGKNRSYVAGWDGIYEISCNGMGCSMSKIDTGGQSIGKLLIADGRNDGTYRLYAATDWDDHVYEYTWSGSNWQVDDCGASGGIAFYDMVAGDGRNDGVNRIYLAANWGGIYELNYDGHGWHYIVVGNPAPYGYVGTVAIGNGRNDGISRVYAWCSPNPDQHLIVEYSYNSGTWSRTSDIDSVVVAGDIAVGPGRNDAINRLYAAAADNHVYEYSFVASALPPVPDIKANGSDVPISISTSDILSITTSLDAGGRAGENIDRWTVAYAFGNWLYYDENSGLWQYASSAFPPSFQGPMSSLAPREVLNVGGLPEGSYIFCFGVDMNMNGALDIDQLDYDYVTVEIRAPQTPTGIDMSGTWHGTWHSSYGESGSFTMDIVQNGSTLSGKVDVPYIDMRDADLNGTINGTSIEFGDVEDRITFSGSVTGDSSASGTYVYPDENDNGSWEANR